LLRPQQQAQGPKKSLCVTENPLSSVDALKVYNQTKSRDEEPEEIPMINLFDLPGNSKAKARAAEMASSKEETKPPVIIKPSINLFGGMQAASSDFSPTRVFPTKVDGSEPKITFKLAPMTIKFSKEVQDKPKDDKIEKDEEDQENKENQNPNNGEPKTETSKTKVVTSANSNKIF